MVKEEFDPAQSETPKEVEKIEEKKEKTEEESLKENILL